MKEFEELLQEYDSMSDRTILFILDGIDQLIQDEFCE